MTPDQYYVHLMLINGADGNEIRTHDIEIGRRTRYQLSYSDFITFVMSQLLCYTKFDLLG